MIDAAHWEKLAGQDPAEVAARGRVRTRDGRYYLALAGEELVVDPGARTVSWANAPGPAKPPAYFHHLVAVCYLNQAARLDPAGEWVAPAQLPGGEFYFRGHHAMPAEKLAAACGDDPEKLVAAGEKLGGARQDYGDAAVAVPAAPRLPLLFIAWAGDDEFPPRASILVDRTADRHLELDALGALAELTVRRLLALIPSVQS